jgi:cobalamin biosynthetic protein CobC
MNFNVMSRADVCGDPAASVTITHGGRLDHARSVFPNAPQPWVDLSTGVNPHAFPLPPIAPQAWTRLPDLDLLTHLEETAARAYQANAHTHVVAGAGSQAFIQLLPRLLSARRVAILGFTYAEHSACWRASGALVQSVATLDDLAQADVAVVVNPNNPDGRIESPHGLADLARRMSKRGGALIIDEAFMDLAPHSKSIVPFMQDDVIVLRSFGKAYGLPGVRLGFALCSEKSAPRLREALGPWSVSGPALAVGAAALADSSWLRDSALKLEQDGARLDSMLRRAGFELIGGASLFRLVSHESAMSWFAHFCERGILTRAFDERPTWLRFGIPGCDDAWTRLSQALEGGHERFR